MAFAATWMDLETIILSVVYTVKDKHQMLSLIMWNKKQYADEVICSKNRLTDFEKLVITKGIQLGMGRMDLGFGNGICTLRYMEQLANGDQLCSTEGSTEYSVIIYVGKKWTYVNVCTTVSLCTAEIITAL